MSHIIKLTKFILAGFLFVSGLLPIAAVSAESESLLANEIQSVDFTSLSGGRVDIRVKLKEALTSPPPRIYT